MVWGQEYIQGRQYINFALCDAHFPRKLSVGRLCPLPDRHLERWCGYSGPPLSLSDVGEAGTAPWGTWLPGQCSPLPATSFLRTGSPELLLFVGQSQLNATIHPRSLEKFKLVCQPSLQLPLQPVALIPSKLLRIYCNLSPASLKLLPRFIPLSSCFQFSCPKLTVSSGTTMQKKPLDPWVKCAVEEDSTFPHGPWVSWERNWNAVCPKRNWNAGCASNMRGGLCIGCSLYWEGCAISLLLGSLEFYSSKLTKYPLLCYLLSDSTKVDYSYNSFNCNDFV